MLSLQYFLKAYSACEWANFFSGIPGCAKSALCKELLQHPGDIGNSRPVESLMGDMTKGKNNPEFLGMR